MKRQIYSTPEMSTGISSKNATVVFEVSGRKGAVLFVLEMPVKISQNKEMPGYTENPKAKISLTVLEAGESESSGVMLRDKWHYTITDKTQSNVDNLMYMLLANGSKVFFENLEMIYDGNFPKNKVQKIIRNITK